MRGVVVVSAIALALPPTPAFTQPKLPAASEAGATEFNIAQLDAMLAPIALFPDELLTQMLMASTHPLQLVAAARWLEKEDNKKRKGDDLVKALQKENWDPSVKSLVPFPQVIVMFNEQLLWMQQLGYAVANQQSAVLNSIQRLRRQAQKAGSLKTTEQQRVVIEQETVMIEPANSETIHVPVYQPTNVYGEWPYPETPPVYIPPPAEYYPAAYAPGYAWGTGLAFAAGAAVVAGLAGWARPRWGYGNVSVNPLRYNNINVGRAQIQGGTWRAAAGGVRGGAVRAPGGPVGAPARLGGLPANAIGRGHVQVAGGAVNRANISAGAIGGQRLGGARAGGAQLGQRTAAGQRLGAGHRAGQGATVLRGGGVGSSRASGAFGGMRDGARASQFGSRGAQSRSFNQGAMGRSGGFNSAGFSRGGGGGYSRGGGGGFSRGGGGGGGFRGGRR